ncbi:MAG: DUF366 family protein [Vampirovibrionales bacterium]
MSQTLFTHWYPTPLVYDGTQLSPHTVLELSGQYGSGLVAFTGGTYVDLAHMVDLEDVRKKAPIESTSMLHLLGEFFHTPLLQGVWMQRLLISCIADTLIDLNPSLFYTSPLLRHGDDLYWYPECITKPETRRKLSVSIVAPSVSSCLLHVGLNLSHEGTPVPTAGLTSHGLLPSTHSPEAFAHDVMQRFASEYASIWRASTKVRGV